MVDRSRFPTKVAAPGHKAAIPIKKYRSCSDDTIVSRWGSRKGRICSMASLVMVWTKSGTCSVYAFKDHTWNSNDRSSSCGCGACPSATSSAAFALVACTSCKSSSDKTDPVVKEEKEGLSGLEKLGLGCGISGIGLVGSRRNENRPSMNVSREPCSS